MGALAPHPPTPPPPSQSKAGRNLPAAITTAVILIAIVLASLFIEVGYFSFVVLVFMLLAMWEMAGAVKARNHEIPILPLWASSIGITAATWFAGELGLLLAFIFSMFVTVTWRLAGRDTWAGRDSLASIFALSWIGLLGGFMLLLARSDFGAWAVMTAVLLPVANDTGGYAAGIFFGKNPMAPTISPKKSWEGFGGSILAAVLMGTACAHFALGIAWWWGIILGVACTIAATCGDLSESLLKRDLGVKDMGSIFPGHGGALDRVDSILVCAPVVYAILLFA